MRAVVQRVLSAAVAIEGVQVASIGRGLLVLVGIHREDSAEDLGWMAQKILELRIFDDSDGKLNLSLLDTQGELLLVSQFTLFGDCRKGRRPSYSDAASPLEAEKLYEEFLGVVRRQLPGAQSGRFQAMMDVTLTNSGPVTLLLDSRKAF
jgi:D-tyrosyl-tRNA(Tyr) deacylase